MIHCEEIALKINMSVSKRLPELGEDVSLLRFKTSESSSGATDGHPVLVCKCGYGDKGESGLLLKASYTCAIAFRGFVCWSTA